MTVRIVKNGEVVAGEADPELLQYCQERNLNITFEWLNGQYWLHSDQEKERPIGVEIDQELLRHEEYFRKSSLQKEILAKAVGVKGPYRPKLLDLTGGMLGDTLLFLSFGCEVVALERNPIIRFLIKSALYNAKHPALSRLTFVSEDALTYMGQHSWNDVIYFDPMFEDPNTKSLPKKEMRIFRSFVGPDTDAMAVFERARQLRPKRLVVKRPRLSVPLNEKPQITYTERPRDTTSICPKVLALMLQIF